MFGKQAGGGQLGEQAAAVGGRNAGEAGRCGGGDIRTGVDPQQPEQARGGRSEGGVRP